MGGCDIVKLVSGKKGELILDEWVSQSISLIMFQGRVVEIVPKSNNSLLSYISRLLKDKLDVDTTIRFNSVIIKSDLRKI